MCGCIYMGTIISCTLERLFYLRNLCEIVRSKNHDPLIFSIPSLASARMCSWPDSNNVINCYLIFLIWREDNSYIHEGSHQSVMLALSFLSLVTWISWMMLLRIANMQSHRNPLELVWISLNTISIWEMFKGGLEYSDLVRYYAN